MFDKAGEVKERFLEALEQDRHKTPVPPTVVISNTFGEQQQISYAKVLEDEQHKKYIMFQQRLKYFQKVLERLDNMCQSNMMGPTAAQVERQSLEKNWQRIEDESLLILANVHLVNVDEDFKEIVSQEFNMIQDMFLIFIN